MISLTAGLSRVKLLPLWRHVIRQGPKKKIYIYTGHLLRTRRWFHPFHLLFYSAKPYSAIEATSTEHANSNFSAHQAHIQGFDPCTNDVHLMEQWPWKQSRSTPCTFEFQGAPQRWAFLGCSAGIIRWLSFVSVPVSIINLRVCLRVETCQIWSMGSASGVVNMDRARAESP